MKPTQKQIDKLIEAAIAYADIAERHRENSESISAYLRQAAVLARGGDQTAARNMQQKADSERRAFDYSNVHLDLIKAVNPFKKICKK